MNSILSPYSLRAELFLFPQCPFGMIYAVPKEQDVKIQGVRWKISGSLLQKCISGDFIVKTFKRLKIFKQKSW